MRLTLEFNRNGQGIVGQRSGGHVLQRAIGLQIAEAVVESAQKALDFGKDISDSVYRQMPATENLQRLKQDHWPQRLQDAACATQHFQLHSFHVDLDEIDAVPSLLSNDGIQGRDRTTHLAGDSDAMYMGQPGIERMKRIGSPEQ